MTPEQINELFATKIWGWNIEWRKASGGGMLENVWADIEGAKTYREEDYTPVTNWIQAFEALEKFCKDNNFGFSLTWVHNTYRASIHAFLGGPISSFESTDKATAICNALIEALEGK
jgi:hypothetical protein